MKVKNKLLIKQMGLYLANLSPTKGHEQSGFRPVLVLQNNILNKNLSTVVVAPITTNLKAKDKLTTYFLPAKKSFLNKDSVVLLFQIRTLDINRLKKEISIIDSSDFQNIMKQLQYVF